MVSNQELSIKVYEKLENTDFLFTSDSDGILVCYVKEPKQDIFFNFGDECKEDNVKEIIGSKHLDVNEDGFITLSPEEFLSRFNNNEISELISLAINNCGDSNCGYEHVCRLIFS